MHHYIPNTEEEQLKMLKEVGIASFEELLDAIPKALRFKGDLPLPPAKSEIEHKKDENKSNDDESVYSDGKKEIKLFKKRGNIVIAISAVTSEEATE